MVGADDLLLAAKAERPMAEQRALLERGLLERGVDARVVASAMSLAQDGVLLTPADRPTRSRVGGGGTVRLPTGATWPESYGYPLAFLFEIALDDLIGAHLVDGAPLGGSLLLFHDEEPGLWGSMLSATRVMFRANDDPGVVTTEGTEYDLQPLGQVALEGLAMPNIASRAELRQELEVLFASRDTATSAQTQVNEALNELMPAVGPSHLLLGAPETRQRPLDEEIASWFRQPEAEPDRAQFSEAELRGEGWRPLLQPTDVRHPDLQIDWSTAGDIFHVIPEVDLKAKRFDRVITVFQG